MNAIAAEATPRIQEFSQQNLSNLCWAFGKLGHFDGKLMAAIAERSIVLIKVLYAVVCARQKAARDLQLHLVTDAPTLC